MIFVPVRTLLDLYRIFIGIIEVARTRNDS